MSDSCTTYTGATLCYDYDSPVKLVYAPNLSKQYAYNLIESSGFVHVHLQMEHAVLGVRVCLLLHAKVA